MKRMFYTGLSLGVATVLVLLLAGVVASQPAARAAGNTLRAPNEYPTRQAAIDASTDGDTILVAAGVYAGNLAIGQGVTLSGGWNISFTARIPGDGNIDGQGLEDHWNYLPLVMNRAIVATGWAAGLSVDGYGVIIHTNDGGKTWVRQGSASEVPDVDLSGVAAVDALNAWVVGNDNTILRTEDGGETWQVQQVLAEVPMGDLCGVYAVDGETAWVGGAALGADPAIILHTSDGGDTWTRQGEALNLKAGLCGVYASARNHAWVVGAVEPPNKYGTIVRTTDGGATWQRMPYRPDSPELANYLISIHGLDAKTLWAVGNAQALFSLDGGDTWDDRTPGGGFFDKNGVFVVDHDTVWVVQDDGGIYYSIDAGISWVNQRVPLGTAGDYILRISAVDGQTAWAATAPDPSSPWAPGHILHTADAGETWIAQSTPMSPAFWGISFVR